MPFKAKHNYEENDFYDKILAFSMQGSNDAEIAYQLDLEPETFCRMRKGNYEGWNEEENKKYSERICQVLARGRAQIINIVRGRYLKAALGGIKTHSKTVTKRHIIVNGKPTSDEIIQTTEGEYETPPNMQALATFLYHHDPEWRKVERRMDTEASDIPTDIQTGIDIDKWINEQVRAQQ